jgi:hypothetical protein
MKLVANYYCGSLEGYCKERRCSDPKTTASVSIDWSKKTNRYNRPLIPLSISEWGVDALLAYNSRGICIIALIPDQSNKLKEIVDCNSPYLRDRLVCHNRLGEVCYINGKRLNHERKVLAEFPHFLVIGNIKDMEIRGPADNGVLSFPSRLRFSFQK